MRMSLLLLMCCVISGVPGVASAMPRTPCVWWSDDSEFDGRPVPVATIITAYDPDGVLTGQYQVTTEGQITLMSAGDDPETPDDEGAEPGDTIIFYMNGRLAAVVGGSATWQEGNVREISLNVSDPCRLFDWNGDGIVSIVGDVTPFVECMYYGNCPDWPESRLLCVSDCSHDNIPSIVGDVPCFVNCVYFGNCPE